MAGNRKKRARARYEAMLAKVPAVDAKGAPHKHHIVPASYLVRWEANGRLWATDVLQHRSFPIRAKKIARETDFYRLEGDDLDPDSVPPLIVETMLGNIEEPAIAAIDHLIALADGEQLMGDDRFTLANFLAIQVLRGRHFRARFELMSAGLFRRTMDELTSEKVRDHFGQDLSDDEVAEHIDAYDRIKSGELGIAPTKASSIKMALSMLEVFGFLLYKRRWVVYRSAVPLVTSDEPVVLLGGRNTPRGSVAGMETAGVIFFALDPHHVLVMFHPELLLDEAALEPVLSRDEAAEVNLEITATAHRLRIASGTFPTAPPLPPLPPRVAESVVEDEVPVVNVERSTVIHAFSPSPWLYASSQPLPVGRWWTLDDRLAPGTHPDTPWVPRTGVALTQRGLEEHYKEAAQRRGEDGTE